MGAAQPGRIASGVPQRFAAACSFRIWPGGLIISTLCREPSRAKGSGQRSVNQARRGAFPPGFRNALEIH
jgi:hypothetical protein